MLAKNTQTIVATRPVLVVKETKKSFPLCVLLYLRCWEKNPEYGPKRGFNLKCCFPYNVRLYGISILFGSASVKCKISIFF